MSNDENYLPRNKLAFILVFIEQYRYLINMPDSFWENNEEDKIIADMAKRHYEDWCRFRRGEHRNPMSKMY